MCYNQTGDISTQEGTSLKLVDKFTYLGSSISSTKKDIDASILLYGFTTWMLTKRLEKKLDGNYTRMLRAILNKSWQQHPTRHQLYGHLPPIIKTIQVRWIRHVGYCWRSKDKLISDVLLWTPTYGRAKAGRPARTLIQQLCENMGCSPEDLPETMNDREKWRERARDIRACGKTWQWWLVCSVYIMWLKQFKLRKVPVVVGSIVVDGVLTCCALFHSMYPFKTIQIGRSGERGPGISVLAARHDSYVQKN